MKELRKLLILNLKIKKFNVTDKVLTFNKSKKWCWMYVYKLLFVWFSERRIT